MNYNRVLLKALWKANDYSEMKAYCIRECRKAEQQDFYTKESLYKGLSKEATQIKEQIEKEFNRDVNKLKYTIDNINSLVREPLATTKRRCEYTEEEFNELIEKERNKQRAKAEEQLKLLSIEYLQKKIAPIELFEQAISEILNVTSKPQTKKEATPAFTTLQWSAIFYYVQPDLYGEIQLKKDKLKKFRKDFNVSNSQSNLSNKLNKIERAFNEYTKTELTKHHLSTIKAILPYLENNHSEAFESATDDLERLKDELDRNEKINN